MNRPALEDMRAALKTRLLHRQQTGRETTADLGDLALLLDALLEESPRPVDDARGHAAGRAVGDGMTDADLARWEADLERPVGTPPATGLETGEMVTQLIAEGRRLRAARMTPFCPKCAAQQSPVPDADWIDAANAMRKAWGLPAIQRMEPKAT